MLRNPEYEIVKARSGADALRFLLHDDCALILMDVQMPHLDGVETARLIRANERTRAIPIVFVTAMSDQERYVARGYDAGAIDYLLKPVDPEMLRAKVGAFVELHRAKQRRSSARRRCCRSRSSGSGSASSRSSSSRACAASALPRSGTAGS